MHKVCYSLQLARFIRKIKYIDAVKNILQTMINLRVELLPVITREATKLARRRDDDKSDLRVTEDGELVCLLEEAFASL